MADDDQQDQQDQDQQDDAQDGQQDDGAKPGTDWRAEARKWEGRAKKNDAAAKANAAAAKQLADIEAANQTATERAEATAKAAEERLQASQRRGVSADLRAALTGIAPDPAKIVGRLDLSQFMTEDGETDTEAVAALQSEYAVFAPPGSRAPRPNPAQGSGQPVKTLIELVADLERKPGKSQSEMRQLMKLKAQQMKATQG